MWCTRCLFQGANAFTHWNKIYHAVLVELFPSILHHFSALCPHLRFTPVLPIVSSFHTFHFSLTPVSSTDLCGCFSEFIWPGVSKICLHWSSCHARSSWGCPHPGVVFVFLWLSSCNDRCGNCAWSLLIITCVYCYWYYDKEVLLYYWFYKSEYCFCFSGDDFVISIVCFTERRALIWYLYCSLSQSC